MKILAILNIDDAPPGLIGEQIERLGGECVHMNPHHNCALPRDSAEFDGLIILGGPMSIADPDYAHIFDPMAALVRDFHDDEKPILGICLGAQLIAKAFGKTVKPHRELQFGFKALRISEEGQNDPLLCGLQPVQQVFVHHLDTFDLPDDALLLMTEKDTIAHTFRIGKTTYAFQSHPEATEDLIRGWAARTRSGVLKHLGERGQEQLNNLDREIARHLPAATHFAREIGGRWAELIKKKRPANL